MRLPVCFFCGLHRRYIETYLIDLGRIGAWYSGPMWEVIKVRALFQAEPTIPLALLLQLQTTPSAKRANITG